MKDTTAKEVVRAYIDRVWSGGELTIVKDFVADEYLGHDPSSSGAVRGPDGVRAAVQGYRAVFPDLRFVIHDQIEENGRVATRWTSHGTHEGAWGTIEPTGKRVEVDGISIAYVKGGKLIEEWETWHKSGLLDQLLTEDEDAFRR